MTCFIVPVYIDERLSMYFPPRNADILIIIPETTTMSIQTARKRLAEQIRAAIRTDNNRSPTNLEELDLVTEQWSATPEARDDRVLDNAYHSFLHFLTDADIRSRDPEYAENQISAMRQLIEKLERPP